MKIKQFLLQTPAGREYRRRKFWRRNEHDNVSGRFYQQFIKPGNTVFDVGANRGNRSKGFLRLGAFVLMVEPQSACAEFLRMVFKNVDKSRWELFEGGLSSAEGEQEMFVSSVDVYSSFSSEWMKSAQESGRFGNVTWEKRGKIPTTTLDLLIRSHGTPSFVKIDVEGYEREVLSGLSIAIPALSFEFGDSINNTFECIDRLSALGDYEFQVSLGESMTMYLPQWVSSSTIKDHLLKITQGSETKWGDVYAKNKKGK